MAGRSSWWKRFGGALAALTLAVLALGPGIDGLICQGDSGLSAAAATLADEASVSSDHPSHETGKGGVDACVHGHCHHASPYTPSLQEQGASFDGALLRLAVAPDAAPTSHPPSGLIRPPRD